MTYSCLKELARVSCCSYRLNLTISLHLDNLLIVSKAGSWLNNACFISINKDSSLSYCSEIGSSFCSRTFDLFSWEIPEDSRGKTVAWKNSMSYNKICSDVLLSVTTISQKAFLIQWIPEIKVNKNGISWISFLLELEVGKLELVKLRVCNLLQHFITAWKVVEYWQLFAVCSAAGYWLDLESYTSISVCPIDSVKRNDRPLV